MQIKVRLFANLRDGREKEMMMDFTENATPKDIIKRLDIPEKNAAIIMVNGIGVKLDTILKDNDTVSIFPPVGGG